MTPTIHTQPIIRQYNLLTYALGYLIGLLIILSVVGLHTVTALISTVVTVIVLQVVSALLLPLMAAGG